MEVGLTATKDDLEWLDFSLEKTYSALQDAGKRFEKLFATYLVLFFISAILTYSKTAGGAGELGIKVPFLDLSLNRPYAAFTVIILATGVFFSLVCLVVYEEVLRWRLEGLILIRHGEISTVGHEPKTETEIYWYLNYPSLFRTSLFLSSAYRFGRVVMSTYFLVAVSGLFWPAIFALHISKELSLQTVDRVFVCTMISILPVLSALVLIALFPRSQSAAAIAEELRNYFRRP